ncbi:22167_t:CDS:2 [Cetraspora pellucida]|uniref:22167_t:CDS:1 n=1 Tax=Cetraspora pellucida TaxID=1433469 RepID=A0A9N8W651_9GLOM|nr:22167_t:CDS:2 [Cetraspora pellucida]
MSHDINLMNNVYKGLRPNIPTHVPKPIAELIVKCWDAKPENRPSSEKLFEIINLEIFLTSSPSHIDIHSEAIYSRRRFTPLSVTSSHKTVNYQDNQKKENVAYVEKDDRNVSSHIKIQFDEIFTRRQSNPLNMIGSDKKINRSDKEENTKSLLDLQDVIDIEQDNQKTSIRVETHPKTIFTKRRLVFLKIKNSGEKPNHSGNNISLVKLA